jgi:hypothetical protein
MALQLSSNVTDALVGRLAPLANLRELSLRGCTGLSGSPHSGFARLAALPRLESLDLSNCDSLQAWNLPPVLPLCCQLLPRAPMLHAAVVLPFAAPHVLPCLHAAAVPPWCDCSGGKLPPFSLSCCWGVDPSHGPPGCFVHAALPDCTQSCVPKQDDAMDVIACMRGLKQLRIVGCTKLTDGALAKLGALPKLTHLDVGCNIHFSDAGIASLAAVASAHIFY